MRQPYALTAILAAIILVATALAGCGGQASRSDADSFGADSLTGRPAYAKGFTISEYAPGMRLLEIADPEGHQRDVYRFALVDSAAAGAEIPEGYEAITVPVGDVVCMTSLQLSNFIALGLQDMVTGITSTRHLRNPRMLNRLAEGKTRQIGIEGNFDTETLLALSPDIIFISPFKRGGFDALRGVGVPLIPHLGYKELSPLGQAEWVKVVGALTGHEAEADSLFAGIESRYNALCQKVKDVDVRPGIMNGEMRGGNWYAQGGESFLAQIFRDAGGSYFLADNHESGGVTLDYESVFARASDVPYWRIVNSYDGPGEFSYQTLADSDQRYTDFAAWRNKGVIYCNMRDVPFYESMPVEPDKVLADFIFVFHPEVMPADYTPTYYHLLRE